MPTAGKAVCGRRIWPGPWESAATTSVWWNGGEKVPSLETLVALLNALHISADMVLTEVVESGYTVKESLLAEQIGRLPQRERRRIHAVVEVLVQQAEYEEGNP